MSLLRDTSPFSLLIPLLPFFFWTFYIVFLFVIDLLQAVRFDSQGITLVDRPPSTLRSSSCTTIWTLYRCPFTVRPLHCSAARRAVPATSSSACPPSSFTLPISSVYRHPQVRMT